MRLVIWSLGGGSVLRAFDALLRSLAKRSGAGTTLACGCRLGSGGRAVVSGALAGLPPPTDPANGAYRTPRAQRAAPLVPVGRAAPQARQTRCRLAGLQPTPWPGRARAAGRNPGCPVPSRAVHGRPPRRAVTSAAPRPPGCRRRCCSATAPGCRGGGPGWRPRTARCGRRGASRPRPSLVGSASSSFIRCWSGKSMPSPRSSTSIARPAVTFCARSRTMVVCGRRIWWRSRPARR